MPTVFRTIAILIALMAGLAPGLALAKGSSSYATRFSMVLDWAIQSNNFVRDHITDRELAAHLSQIAAKQVELCSVWTPPEEFRPVHPHLILVLENVERAFFFASRGNLANYRHHFKVIREELRMVDALLGKYRLKLPEPPR